MEKKKKNTSKKTTIKSKNTGKKIDFKEKIDSLKNKMTKRDEIDKKLSKRRNHFILIGLLIFGICVLLAGLSFLIYIIMSAPEFETSKLYSSESSTFLDVNGKEFGRVGSEDRVLITYDDLPQVLVDAIVATEDSRFFQHEGFDIARFMKASLGQVSGSNAGGASTLTMQVVGTAFTDRKEASGIKGIIRKFTDIYMAIFKLEKTYTKEEIIEFYVNSPWLGNGTWGVEQACQTYFGKSVRDISLPEAALVAGMFNAPKIYNPFYSTSKASERRDTVLYLMYRHGYITEDQYNDAKNISIESLIIDKKAASLNKYQSFIDTVVEEVIDDTGMNPYNVSMTIQTTMDPQQQDVLLKMNNGSYYKWKNDDEQVAVVVTSIENGAITSISGGRNQTTERALNRATGLHTHPGSTAKPIFDYGPMIEFNNASPGTYFIDDKYTYSNGQSIKNADDGFQGLITMRTALSKSRNIPALQAFQAVEQDKIAEFVHNLGINYGDTLYESCSVGGFDGVSPKEMSAAYAAFARGGYYIEPYSYTKVTFNDEKETIEKKITKRKVMDDSTAYMITSILVTAGNEGAGGNFKISGTDIAAKTGTSTYSSEALKALGIREASRDNWNMTYSPDYCIALWYGYDKLTKERYTTSLSAAATRKKLMAGIAKEIYKKNSKFNMPSSVVKVEVEKESIPLALPSEYTPENMRMTEYFKAGSEPTEESFRYAKLENPTNGSASTNGTAITISWNGINTPNAISAEYLTSYFKEYYPKWAEKYYEKRVSYNNSSIGHLTYDIYLLQNGTEKFIATTTDTNYTYQGEAGTNYTFIVRSAYSIFKATSSSGLSITAKTSGSQEDANTITVTLNGKDECKVKSESIGYYNDPIKSNPMSATDINDNDITNKLIVKTPKIINLETNTEVSGINTSIEGKYKITYTVSYNNKDYTLSRTITIANSCEATE